MKLSLALSMMLLLCGCTAYLVGDGAGPGRHHGGTRSAEVSAADTALAGRVSALFAADEVIGVFDLRVSSWNGTVTLTGAVGSYSARQRAETLARGADGVRIVNNQIVIKD